LPTSFSNPLSQLTRADYDYRMGTLIRVTGPNTSGTPTNCAAASYSIPTTEESTCAQYDAFGRMSALIKPGDSTSYPTVQATYYDAEQPFRYRVYQREQAGTGNVRVAQSFYDGLGRQIQTKREGPGGWQNVVVDTRYDGLGRAIEQSQPRYSNENATTFYQYTAPGANLFNPTSTSYDALSRPLDVTAPDGTVTQTRYRIGAQGTAKELYDAKQHLTTYESDALGRLRWVYEYQGNNGSEGGYTNPAVTTYTYSPLDLLTGVSDANGNTTSMGYDTLGRKTGMSDPDMGNWSYAYNINGTLASQIDAKSQTTLFYYDNLDRLTTKAAWDQTNTYAYDDTTAPNKGIGHRTAMSTYAAGIYQTYERWEYDARGRTTLAGQAIAGAPQRDLLRARSAANARAEQWPDQQLGVCRPAAAAARHPDWHQRRADQQDSPGLCLRRGRQYPNHHRLCLGPYQNFTYDHRDRLTRAWTTGGAGAAGMAYDISTTYNAIGNLTSKSGLGNYSYGANGDGTGAGPHQARTIGALSLSYDANGNMAVGGAWNYTWNADNTLAGMTNGTAPESYIYDADGERVLRTAAGVTTMFFAGVWEETTSGVRTLYYQFNGQVVAMRSSTGVTYIQGDHLGSMTWAFNASGGTIAGQEYGPWGQVRAGSMVTRLNYTGQRLDSSGLLYYHARYYNPLLGRFISADSVVPGNASGGMDGVALKGLTVGFHEPGFVAQIAGENNQPFWFQMGDEQRGNVGSPWGPANPQALNRYSYVQNNPLRSKDPSGHAVPPDPKGGGGIPNPGKSGGKPRSNPYRGTTGSTSTTYQDDGTPKQTRTYGPDGYPESDVDYDHDHDQGIPHEHKWGRPGDGSPPTYKDRGIGRPVGAPSNPFDSGLGIPSFPSTPNMNSPSNQVAMSAGVVVIIIIVVIVLAPVGI
jgi:RHS repeat-associated protein